MSLEETVYRLSLQRLSENQIAKRLRLSPQSVKEIVRRLDGEWRRMAKQERATEKMISDARRSNLCVRMVDFTTRDFAPKATPGDGGRGRHFLPSGLADKDFTQTGISLAAAV